LRHKTRLAVLASGKGTNLQAVLDACRRGELPMRVAAVFSDRPGAHALARARRAGIPAEAFPWRAYARAGAGRAAYDAALAEMVARHHPDLVLLAGWMRILSRAFLERFPMRVLNLHPALPGQFPGIHAIERAFRAYRAGEIAETGVMVHFVPDEGVDDGPVLAQSRVPILADDTLESLAARIHQTEHRLLVVALAAAAERLAETTKEAC
jgi:formyltetrahydrofolate-dependent phosphoribosylglycinamide formyltransferase